MVGLGLARDATIFNHDLVKDTALLTRHPAVAWPMALAFADCKGDHVSQVRADRCFLRALRHPLRKNLFTALPYFPIVFERRSLCVRTGKPRILKAAAQRDFEFCQFAQSPPSICRISATSSNIVVSSAILAPIVRQ